MGCAAERIRTEALAWCQAVCPLPLSKQQPSLSPFPVSAEVGNATISWLLRVEQELRGGDEPNQSLPPHAVSHVPCLWNVSSSSASSSRHPPDPQEAPALTHLLPLPPLTPRHSSSPQYPRARPWVPPVHTSTVQHGSPRWRLNQTSLNLKSNIGPSKF